MAAMSFLARTLGFQNHRAQAGETAGTPGADDLVRGLHAGQLAQVVGREVQLLEVDESPGDDGGQRSQAVGRQVELGDLAGDVDEPVQIDPGQLETGPLHTKRLL